MLDLAFDDGLRGIGVTRLPAPEVTVAAVGGDRLPRAEQPRTRLPRRDAVAQREFEPLAPAEIAGSGDARANHGLRPALHALHQGGIRHRELGVRRREGGVQRHVDVGIDEAGNDGQAGDVAVVPFRYAGGVAHGRDPPVLDGQGVSVSIPARHTVPDADVSEDRALHAGHCSVAAGSLARPAISRHHRAALPIRTTGRDNRPAHAPREDS